ncbi:MAG: ABC transporter ATP-binding protein/permease [Clostridia bacterium]|nr:ABC transporter ATP-binding protein/permease [Clostridia bacterium]
MLKIEKITKTYQLGDMKVEALKGVSLEFRKSEFVSILGPSGCGKTTLLNIIGGLDRYTNGDIIINQTSTKLFKDKDWDAYRNHSVGFVFQSYNLIPHQTVLENVELALTLSGVSKEERRKRATKVLEKVGLSDKLKSKPNQLSGGQMQRVAIARALVNDPEIILADEPTGALDSKTSVQIMELLKEISKDKLIVMVTHNPELAEKYSSRIVKLLDGKLVDDSNPYKAETESKKEKKLLSVADNAQLTKAEQQKKGKKKKMSFWTALSLSFKNLLTKKGRTILVAFAGSIGIIGIALILAISSGFSTYVNKMQEDSLSSYPITIEAKNVDFTALMTSMFLDMSTSANADHDKDAVYPKENITSIIDNVGKNLKANDLKKFYNYLNDNYEEISPYVNGIQYTYNIGLEFNTMPTNGNILTSKNVQPNSPAIMQMIKKYALFYFEKHSYTKVSQDIDALGSCLIETTEKTFDENYKNILDDYAELSQLKLDLQTNGRATLSNQKVMELVFTIMGMSSGGSESSSSSLGGVMSQMNIFYEMLDNKELIQSQYDLVTQDSRFIENKNEALLVLDKNNELDDYVLYALGLITDAQMDSTMHSLVYGQKNTTKIEYDQIIGREYKILTESDYFIDDPKNPGSVIDIRTLNMQKINDQENPNYNPTLYYTYYYQALTNSINKIKIVGIVRLNGSSESGSLKTGIAYSSELTKDLITNHINTGIGVTSGKLESVKLDSPASINIYVNTFESKATVQNFIDKYNDQAASGDEISYTDFAGIIMSSVSTIINSITYVLIAFVSVSLIVSSIMIGIITYISVIERTKEIGVLRSVGASKKDVKRVFTAESFIIGLASGLFGILTSVLLIIPINLILKSLTGIGGLATLPVLGATLLVVISVLLTFIAGLVPAKAAAKKDPVIALRSE